MGVVPRRAAAACRNEPTMAYDAFWCSLSKLTQPSTFRWSIWGMGVAGEDEDEGEYAAVQGQRRAGCENPTS